MIEIIGVLAGFLTALGGLALVIVTLSSKIVQGIKAAAHEVLVESGLVKPGDRETVWPNGSDTLPDFLENLYDIITAHHDDGGPE